MAKDINCSCCYMIAWKNRTFLNCSSMAELVPHFKGFLLHALQLWVWLLFPNALLMYHKYPTYSNHPKCFLSQGWTAGVLHGSDHTEWSPVLCWVILSPTPTLGCIQLSKEMRSLVRRLRLKWATSWAVLFLGLDGGGIIIRFEQVAC